jgi:hypothetical protein
MLYITYRSRLHIVRYYLIRHLFWVTSFSERRDYTVSVLSAEDSCYFTTFQVWRLLQFFYKSLFWMNLSDSLGLTPDYSVLYKSVAQHLPQNSPLLIRTSIHHYLAATSFLSWTTKCSTRMLQSYLIRHCLLCWISVNTTERRGRVVNPPASGGSGFKSRPRDRLSWLRLFVVFSFPLGKCQGSTLKIGHDRFLPHPVQLTIHASSFHSTLYSRGTTTRLAQDTFNNVWVLTTNYFIWLI